ncbi:hypothetical protein IL306_007588 [Fusarium sp. DS 682]|nr:hypothetical protein IL306_007588 [Fusarium sp. DS 682]
MATGPGLNAAKVLQDEGISTLGTGVFSVAQAVACSQARCLYVSPFRSYKEILASAELGCHSATISQDLLEDLKSLTLGKVAIPAVTKLASVASPYSDDMPIPSPRIIGLLARDRNKTLGKDKEWWLTDLSIDFLADKGKALDQAIDKDMEAARMVKEALDMFVFCEKETQKLIEGITLVASL